VRRGFFANNLVLKDLKSGAMDCQAAPSLPANSDIGLGVAIRSDGKIVAVGRSFAPGRTAFAVARYNTNGTLDTTFGTGGKATTSFVGSSVDQAFSVAIQPDGKAVVAGSADVNLTTQFALARYQ
jgi:uncharacterized delta-60 repeat protein